MKKANKKTSAAIIIIGNEILSGRTQDVNVVAISNWLNELGVRLEEVRVIPDIEDSIAKTINIEIRLADSRKITVFLIHLLIFVLFSL